MSATAEKPSTDIDQLALSFSRLQTALDEACSYVDTVVVSCQTLLVYPIEVNLCARSWTRMARKHCERLDRLDQVPLCCNMMAAADSGFQSVIDS